MRIYTGHYGADKSASEIVMRPIERAAAVICGWAHNVARRGQRQRAAERFDPAETRELMRDLKALCLVEDHEL